MKKSLHLDLRFIKFVWILALVAGLSGAAFGTTFTVTKIADTNDNICDADCSLREAIAAANTAVTNDVINFDMTAFATAQTMVLVYGDLKINNNGSLIINGPGANFLTLDGIYQARIFTINGATVTIGGVLMTKGIGYGVPYVISGGGGIASTSGSIVTINDSIIKGAVGSSANGIVNDGTLILNNSIVRDHLGNINGGGIYNAPNSTLTITNSSIINNNGGGNFGGGIYNDTNVAANIVNSTIKDNSLQNGSGAGIYHTSGTLNITNSVFVNNITTGVFGGGGVQNINGSVNITNSTFNSNSAGGGGGINISVGGTLIITGSTFSNNAITGGRGGGIANDGILSITNSTINGNTATPGTSFNGGNGGGIFNSGTASIVNSTISSNNASSGGLVTGGGGVSNTGTVNLRNTIVGDNSASFGAPDFGGVVNSQGYNLIENTAGTRIIGTTIGNILGQDPQLLPLSNNGGTTGTIALLATSPAIDAADPNNFPAIDQRGIARPQDGDLNGSNLPDIGAYEKQTMAFRVTKNADTNDGACNADCSLREAIAAANAVGTSDNTIIFDDALFAAPQFITLTGGEIQINNNSAIAIIGKGANLLTISGGDTTRVLSTGTGTTTGISGVTITGGNTSTSGGGISNGGKLVITNSIIRGNTANSFGGGIFNNDGGILNLEYSAVDGNTANAGGGLFISNNSNLTVAFSTVSGNTALSTYGGGISISGTVDINKSTVSGNNGCGIYNGWMTNINDSTISGNTTNGNGGGIYNDVTLNINNSTIANNRSVNQGGGIFRNAGTVYARSSIFADNTAPTAPDFSGILISGGYNLIENTSGATINGVFEGNITNQDPRLAPLGNYGGATQTHPLRPKSPAIDKGFSIGFADQRVQPRPYDFPNISNASNGNGSDIGAFERQAFDSNFTAPFDFDGDGKSDLSVFRPSNGGWYINQSANGFTGIAFGQAGDKIVPADYDGDGKTDVAIYRSGTWYLNRSQLGFTAIGFGTTEDIAQPADFDGDGKAELAVFRPSNGYWYVLNLANNQFTAVLFGQMGDKPVAADYDGDGRADYAVYRNGGWYILRSSQGFIGIQFGISTDRPVPADYDGDGKADVAVFRPSNGTWYLNRSMAGFAEIQFGITTDVPAPADYDGDGKTDIAVFREGAWYLQRSLTGFMGVAFGASGDQAVPNAYVR